MNFCGGGKLGMYTAWVQLHNVPECGCPSPFAPQFEFYDYYASGD